MLEVADTGRPRRGSRTSRMRRGGMVLLVGCLAAALLTPSASVGARKHAATAKVKKVKAVKRTNSAIRIGMLPTLRTAGLPVDLACVASFQFDFSPKLNNNTVSSQTTAALTNCLSPNGSRSDLLSAVLFADRGHSSATGCAPAPVAIDGVGSILWNDGTSSDFTFRVNTNPFASAFGLEAKILTGTYAGHKITAVPLLLLQDGLCGVNGGVNSLSVTLGVDIVTG
jgi:hypothetical protein